MTRTYPRIVFSEQDACDLNGDGKIGLGDISRVAAYWNQTVQEIPMARTYILTRTPGADVNSLALIASDMTSPHMGHAAGTGGYSWEFGPIRRSWSPSAPNCNMWAMLVRNDTEEGTQTAIVQVQDTRHYALLSDFTWQLVTQTFFGGQVNDENFGPTIYSSQDPPTYPPYQVPINRGVQFYTGGVARPATAIGFWARYQAKLSSAIDGRIMFNCGGDWSGVGDWSFGRLKTLTLAWQWANCTSISDAVLAAHPPPL